MSTVMKTTTPASTDPLMIDGISYQSRLLVGTGKYRDMEETRLAVEASGAEIVTVAIRRTNIGQNAGEPSLLDVLPPDRYTYLPNTAGCYSEEDAVRTCRLARELLDGHNLVKLEVLGDEKTLFPDITQTLSAAETLIADGFRVMVYTNDDPIIARRLEEMGCVAVMPLAAPIGSGLGIRNPYNILTIVENATVPILVDAGVGCASDAAIAMELGCDGVLMNTAIAAARDPILMASAMRKAIEAVTSLVTDEEHLVAYTGAAIEGNNLHWVDVHHSAGSKGSAVSILKEELGVQLVEVHRLEDQRRETAVAGHIRYDPTHEGENHPRASTVPDWSRSRCWHQGSTHRATSTSTPPTVSSTGSTRCNSSIAEYLAEVNEVPGMAHCRAGARCSWFRGGGRSSPCSASERTRTRNEALVFPWLLFDRHLVRAQPHRFQPHPQAGP